MKHSISLLTILLVGAFTCNAQSPLRKSMTDTFVKYAGIDSQSSYDSISTVGQHNMALALQADVKRAIASSGVKGVDVSLSDQNYLYVDIPANIKNTCPVLGISCHLDVTPEAPGGKITPVVDKVDGRDIIRTDGSTLLGADDKCGCTIAMELIRKVLDDKKLKHGRLLFAFCPNEDVGRAADAIDSVKFNPDILFDLDGEGGEVVTRSNFTARGLNLKFIGNDAHPSQAKALNYGDATAAAAAFISSVPLQYRPENTEGLQGYIHPFSFEKEKDGSDVVVMTRIRYFDKNEGDTFDNIVMSAIDKIRKDFPNVKVEVLFDGLQYENVAYTIHPKAKELVENAAAKTGKQIKWMDERGGTTASMFASKGLKGGMCVFTGQHDTHSTREYADLQEMEEAYDLMLEIIRQIPKLK